MIEKPKRPKKIPNQDNKQPQTIQELIRRYDLDNTKIYDFLDELVGSLNKKSTYSTEEQVIGKWIDGKTIYRKVISVSPTTFGSGTASEGATYKIPHGINYIDIVTRCDVYWKVNGEQQRRFPSIYYNNMAWAGQAFVDVSDGIVFELGSSILNAMRIADYIYVVLEYTKTTD